MKKFLSPILDAIRGPRQGQADPPSLVIVGLGNPGGEYAGTRHNIGFWCLDRLAKEHSVTFSRRNRSALVGEGVIEGRRVALAKPRTFVNRSGGAITYLLARFRVSPQKLLIIYDDINLPVGKLRLRPRGSAGGHNGIKSIIEAVGTQDFPRIRVGVGRPSSDGNQIDHVLGAMSPEEQEATDDALKRVVQAVSSLLIEGIDATMSKFN